MLQPFIDHTNSVKRKEAGYSFGSTANHMMRQNTQSKGTRFLKAMSACFGNMYSDKAKRDIKEW